MKTKHIIAAVLALIIAANIHFPVASAGYPSWPEFHGTGRKNISPDKGLLKKWPEGGPKLLWTYSQCGRGYSGVSIAEGMIFTAGDVGREEMVIALDMNGKPLWKRPNGKAWRGSSPGSRATPTYNDGSVYHMNPDGRLAAYQAKSGKPLWSVDLKSKFDTEPELIPSSGGVFEVEVDGQLIFSKQAEDRFPEQDEIFASIEKLS